MTCSHSGKECKRGHLCEWCPVPNAYGFFLRQDKHGRMVWDQKFILESDRMSILGYLDNEIAKLQKRKEEIMAIPGKDEYDRS